MPAHPGPFSVGSRTLVELYTRIYARDGAGGVDAADVREILLDLAQDPRWAVNPDAVTLRSVRSGLGSCVRRGELRHDPSTSRFHLTQRGYDVANAGANTPPEPQPHARGHRRAKLPPATWSTVARLLHSGADGPDHRISERTLLQRIGEAIEEAAPGAQLDAQASRNWLIRSGVLGPRVGGRHHGYRTCHLPEVPAAPQVGGATAPPSVDAPSERRETRYVFTTDEKRGWFLQRFQRRLRGAARMRLELAIDVLGGFVRSVGVPVDPGRLRVMLRNNFICPEHPLITEEQSSRGPMCSLTAEGSALAARTTSAPPRSRRGPRPGGPRIAAAAPAPTQRQEPVATPPAPVAPAPVAPAQVAPAPAAAPELTLIQRIEQLEDSLAALRRFVGAPPASAPIRRSP